MYIFWVKRLVEASYQFQLMIADNEVLDVFTPGSHGSTFGGNPLACAVSIAALDVIIDENLPEHSNELGEYFKSELQRLITLQLKKFVDAGYSLVWNYTTVQDHFVKH